MTPQKNEIVVYQPNDIMRIEVRFEDETVWLQQPRIAELFACSLENVRLHLKNIYANGELDKAATSKESLEVRQEGTRRVTRRVVYYNLDAIISIGYRVNSTRHGGEWYGSMIGVCDILCATKKGIAK